MMSCDVKLKEYVDELTKCPICLEDVANPKSLPCLHTFCLQCIGKHCRDDSPGDQRHCPVCRSSFVIPDDGVDQLPDNFFIKGLADVKKSSDKSSEIFTCDECSDGSAEEANNIMPATMQCIGCGQNLCEKCSKPHRRISGGGHEIVLFEPDLLRQILKSRGSFCGRHAGNRLEIYCIECNENMCVTCSHGNKHREHYVQVRPIDEVYVEFQKTIEHDIQLVLDKEKSVKEKAAASMIEQQQVEDEIMSKETDLSRISGEIMSKVDEAVRQLTVLLSDEKTEVSKIATARTNEFEFELAAFQSFTRYSSELMKKGKPCEITQAYIELHARAGELLQREVKTDDYKLPASTVLSRDLYDEIFDYSSVNSARYQAREKRAATEMRRLTQEKDAVDQRLKKMTTDYDVKVNHLEAENIVITKERDTMIDDRSKLIAEKELLGQDKDGITKERDTLKDHLFEVTAEKKQLKKDKDVITKERDTFKDDRSKLIAEKELLEQDKDGITKERDTLKDHLSKVTAQKEKLILQFGKVKCVHTTNDDKPIFGMAILNREIYVGHRDTTDIKVYDTETFTEQRTLPVPRLGRVSDMTSCKRHQCIYIADGTNKLVHRVDNRNTITQWSVNDEPESISVNSAADVLVTCSRVCKVKVFTTDGKLIHEIKLDSSINNPWHTVELKTDKLVVSQGHTWNPVNRVCIVDLSGRVMHSYSGKNWLREEPKDLLNVPVRLAVNAGVIFVADCWNHRVLMMNSMLSLIREVVVCQNYPFRIWFDAETRRMYVAENKGLISYSTGKLVLYNIYW